MNAQYELSNEHGSELSELFVRLRKRISITQENNLNSFQYLDCDLILKLSSSLRVNFPSGAILFHSQFGVVQHKAAACQRNQFFTL